MEKPWATDDKTVNELADLAERKKRGRVPTPFRYNWLTEVAIKMKRARWPDLPHAREVQQRGIQRYIDLAMNGC